MNFAPYHFAEMSSPDFRKGTDKGLFFYTEKDDGRGKIS